MSMYPNSSMNEPLDVKPEAPTQGGSDRRPAARPFFENSDHVTGDENKLDGGGKPDGLKPPQQGPDGTAAVELPEAIQRLRNLPERKMFDAELTYKSVFQRGTSQDAAVGEDPEVIAAIDREVSNIFSDLRLSNNDAQNIFDTFKAEVDETTAASWRTQSEA